MPREIVLRFLGATYLMALFSKHQTSPLEPGIRHHSRLLRIAVRCVAAALLLPIGITPLSVAASGDMRGGTEDTTKEPEAIVKRVIENEIQMLSHNGMYLRYRMRKVDDKGDKLRDVIETRQGTVARLIENQGRPLTPEENQMELDRLNSMLAHPEEFAKHQRRDQMEKDRAEKLLRLVPEGLIFEVASPQMPIPGVSGLQQNILQLNFKPNLSFQPTMIESQILKSMQGHVWVNTIDHEIAHFDVQLISDAAFGWGLLGKVYKGGTLVLDQADAGGGHWILTHLRENLTVRALLVRTISLNVKEDLGDFSVLRKGMDYQEGIRILQQTPLIQQAVSNQ